MKIKHPEGEEAARLAGAAAMVGVASTLVPAATSSEAAQTAADFVASIVGPGPVPQLARGVSLAPVPTSAAAAGAAAAAAAATAAGMSTSAAGMSTSALPATTGAASATAALPGSAATGSGFGKLVTPVMLKQQLSLMNGGDEDEEDRRGGEGRWTREEDESLRQAVALVGPRSWKRIATEFLADTRTDVQCLHRWQKVLRPGLVKGPWMPEEDEIIRSCMHNGVTRWSEIAKQVKGRIGKQCRERWFNHLDPTIVKGEWTEAEDIALIQGQQELGNRWSEIAKRYLPGRPENAVKNRWNAATRRRRPCGDAGAGGAGLHSSSISLLSKAAASMASKPVKRKPVPALSKKKKAPSPVKAPKGKKPAIAGVGAGAGAGAAKSKAVGAKAVKAKRGRKDLDAGAGAGAGTLLESMTSLASLCAVALVEKDGEGGSRSTAKRSKASPKRKAASRSAGSGSPDTAAKKKRKALGASDLATAVSAATAALSAGRRAEDPDVDMGGAGGFGAADDDRHNRRIGSFGASRPNISAPSSLITATAAAAAAAGTAAAGVGSSSASSSASASASSTGTTAAFPGAFTAAMPLAATMAALAVGNSSAANTPLWKSPRVKMGSTISPTKAVTFESDTSDTVSALQFLSAAAETDRIK